MSLHYNYEIIRQYTKLITIRPAWQLHQPWVYEFYELAVHKRKVIKTVRHKLTQKN